MPTLYTTMQPSSTICMMAYSWAKARLWSSLEFSYLCVQELKCYSLEMDMQTPSNTIGLYNRQDAQKMKNIPAYRL